MRKGCPGTRRTCQDCDVQCCVYLCSPHMPGVFLGNPGWLGAFFPSSGPVGAIPSGAWTKHYAQVPLFPHGVEPGVLNWWEAGQMKDTASKNVFNRFSVWDLFFSSAGTVIWHRSWERGIFGRVRTLIPSFQLTLHLSSEKGPADTLLMPTTLCKSIAVLMCLHPSPVPKGADTPPPPPPHTLCCLRCRK